MLCLGRFEQGLRQEERGKTYAEQSTAAKYETEAGSTTCESIWRVEFIDRKSSFQRSALAVHVPAGISRRVTHQGQSQKGQGHLRERNSDTKGLPLYRAFCAFGHSSCFPTLYGKQRRLDVRSSLLPQEHFSSSGLYSGKRDLGLMDS